MNPIAYEEMAEVEGNHWWFSGRRAILREVIRNLGLGGTAKILEVGAGTGGNLEMLADFGTVAAVEMDDHARSIALEKTRGRFDIRAGSFPDAVPSFATNFDLICLFDVLEHIDSDVETLGAIRNLLAPRGRVLLTVPAYQWMWSSHDAFLHHKRRYSAAHLRSVVTSAGYRPSKLSYFNTLLFPAAALARIRDRLVLAERPKPTRVPPKPVNHMLAGIFSLERFVLPRMDLPYGVSLLCVIEAMPGHSRVRDPARGTA
jgi:SAM-dependent methyltransferase